MNLQYFDQTEIEENDFMKAEWSLKALSNSSFFKLIFRYHNIKAQKRRAKRIYPTCILNPTQGQILET